jgi:hypothetical protein
VVGSRFGLDVLTVLGAEPVVDDLVTAQLIDQVSFTRQPEYVFRHPLIRTVAYESQLKSDRARLHRRLAAAIEAREPESADQNAALIGTLTASPRWISPPRSTEAYTPTLTWLCWAAVRRMPESLGRSPEPRSS